MRGNPTEQDRALAAAEAEARARDDAEWQAAQDEIGRSMHATREEIHAAPPPPKQKKRQYRRAISVKPQHYLASKRHRDLSGESMSAYVERLIEEDHKRQGVELPTEEVARSTLGPTGAGRRLAGGTLLL